MNAQSLVQRKQTTIHGKGPPSQSLGSHAAISSRLGGFTLVELLVVIAVISILAALLLPVLAIAKDRAVRTKCLSNVKELNMGLIMYAHENNDLFPVAVGDDEPYDLPAFLTPQLLGHGATRDIMYDPGYPDFNNNNNWNDSPNVTRDIGYVLTFASPTSWIALSNQNSTMRVPNPSDRVLLAGLVLSAIGQSATDARSRASYNYTQIPVDASPSLLRCPHLNGKMPAGDNQGMMDGRAQWRNFAKMLPRNGPLSPGYDGNGDADDAGSSTAPVCWW
jgi:prepilin-type N-terminal cleavage/methylation domain-containing protein